MRRLSRTAAAARLLALLVVAFAHPVARCADETDDAATGFAQINSELRVAVLNGRQLILEVRATGSEDFAAVAKRFAPGHEEALRAFNHDLPPTAGSQIRVPLELLSPETRALVLRNLFPDDRADGGDWLHVARAGVLPTYDEGLWQVANWFTGNGSGFQSIMQANGLNSPELRKNQVVRIPASLLHPAFRARLHSDDGTLEYGVDDAGAYAAYRLRQGEALYSAVVVRFTGRTGAEDVGEITEEILARSDIRDPRDIPVHFEVKIPFSLLEPEYLPQSHPRRVEAEAQRAELALELARKPLTGTVGGLKGTLIVLDPGHGGRDLGTMNNGIWEHDYVYDVACRLRQKLERQTSAHVFMTLEDEETGCVPSSGDKLVANRQGTIQTVPPFLARKDGEAQVGVNLRWYLANSIYRKALKDGYDADRVVFLSLHADARHPSLSGIMVYVPAAGYRTKTYGSTSKTYSRFKEVREKPHVNFSRSERVRSEAVSRKYADEVVESFRGLGLPVQPYQPVRDKVIRGDSKWVPAVLRGNEIPTKVLIEMVNLSNREDAAVLASALERDRLADALFDSLHRHFGEPPDRIASQGNARP
jgi:N-acetylmuramoyl-L-alanine amidase